METFAVIAFMVVVYAIYIFAKLSDKKYGPSSRNMARYKANASRSGHKNPVYEEKLSDSRWKAKRERILERDGHRCQWCGRTYGLQVHHKYYMLYPDGSFADPWDYPDSTFMTLCDECHRKCHEKYKIRTYHRKWGVHYE